MKKWLLVICATLSFSAASYSQDLGAGDIDTEMSAPNLPKVLGVIRRIELGNPHIVIKHEEIPNLSMPAMTMNFAVADREMIKNLKPNDKVLFMADMIDNVLTVVWIEKK